MLPWRFRTYVSETGRGEVQKHIDALDVEAAEFFRAAVRWLAPMPASEWHEPKAKKLHGYKELYEIRFKANGVQQRPIGFFGPESNQFTILIWATHKQRVYKPAEALDTADRRRKAVVTKTAGSTPLQVDGEDFPTTEEP